MLFELDEDQRALRDSLERLLADQYDMARRATYAAEPGGFSRKMWARYAELGLLGLLIAPEHGGSDLGPGAAAMVMETLGHALILEPWLATAVLGAVAITQAGNAAQRQALLPRIAAGELTLAWAHEERAADGVARVATSASRDDAGWLLAGAKHCVVHAPGVDRLLVSARLADGGTDGGDPRLGLFLVDPQAPGLTRTDFPTQDGLRAAHVEFSQVRVNAADALLGADGATVIETVLDHGIAILCAEAVGVMQEMLDRTVDYLKTRQQFGVAIGSFQVLQHRAVDMLVALDAARSMALYATAMLAESDPLERHRAMAAAKVQIGRSARYVGQQTVQLHGGMGMSLETKAAQCFLRSSVIEQSFGSAASHLRTLARLGGLDHEARA